MPRASHATGLTMLLDPPHSNHVPVSPSTWIPLGLPDPKEVQNLSLQVVNFHRPLVGTFHQKAMVVDRRIAVLNSNNIQDRPNLEVSRAEFAHARTVFRVQP